MSVQSLAPPQALESEQAIIEEMIWDFDVAGKLKEELAPDEFASPFYRDWFTVLCAAHDHRIPFDARSLNQFIEARGGMVFEQWTAYVGDVRDKVFSALGVRYAQHHAAIVRDRAVYRRVIKTCADLMADAYQMNCSSDDLVRRAESQVMTISDRIAGDDALVDYAWYDIEAERIREMQEADAKGYQEGFRSPLRELNAKLEPITPTQLVIIAARPRIGKTSFGVQWAWDAAKSQGQKGLFVSVEMSRRQLALRRLMAQSGVEKFAMTSLNWRKEHPSEVYPALEETAMQSLGIPLHIVDAPAITPAQLLTVARRVRRKLDGLDFIVVDYLQRMEDNRHTREDTPRVTAITKELKQIAKRLDCAVIALAQLNREAETREGERPMLRHMKDSGQIEQEADVVLALNRPDQNDKQRVEIGIIKQRHGDEAWVEVGFCPWQTWFYNSVNDVPERRDQ